jgi:polysaccharide transporter, PST family
VRRPPALAAPRAAGNERIGWLSGWSRDLVLSVRAHLLQKLPGLVAAVTLARHFDKALMGQFVFCGAVAMMTAVLGHLGTDRELHRWTAQRPEAALERLGQVLALRLVVVAIAWPALNAALWLAAPEMLPIALLTSLYILLGDLFFTFSALLVGLRRTGLRLATGAIGPLLIALSSLVVFWGVPLVGVLALYALANLIMLGVTRVAIRRAIGPVVLDWRLDRLRPVVAAAAPFFLIEVVLVVQSKIDTAMIFAMVSTVAVAEYEAAYRLLEVTRTLVRPVLMVFFPIAAAMAAIGRGPELRRLVGRLTVAIAALGALVTAAAMPLAEPLATGVWGAAYGASAALFGVLSIATAPVFLVLACVSLAGALHQERRALHLLAATAVLNVALNLVAIPAYGPLGAAWATVVTETVAAAALLTLVLRSARMRPGGIPTGAAGTPTGGDP